MGDRSYHFKPLDKNDRYEDQLVTVYQHRRDRGGCGHVFAPLELRSRRNGAPPDLGSGKAPQAPQREEVGIA